jgi:hypothetical protein
MIRDCEIERFREIIRRSGVPEIIDRELKGAGGSRTGRPSRVNTADWLVMGMAAANYGRPLHSSEVRRLFTDQHHVTRDMMIKLGTRFVRSINPRDDLIASESQFETRLRKIGQRLAWLSSSAPNITPEEAVRREGVLQEISRALLKASQPNDLAPTGAMAVDGTAVEGYGLYRKDSADPDARPGHRTPKLGELKSFFGYMYFTFRRIPADGADNPIAEPGLIEQLVVRPGNVAGGVGNPVMDFVLKAARQEGLKELLADAAWFNTESEEFVKPLQLAGVRVTIPPSTSIKQLTSFQGNPMYFATPLCSGTPKEILDIARDLKRPPVLSLEANFSEAVLESLATDPSLIEVEMEILAVPEEDAPVDKRLAEDADEYEETTALIQDPDESSNSKGKSKSTSRKARWEAFIKRPYLERRQALAVRKRDSFNSTQTFLKEIAKLEPYALVLKEEASVTNNWVSRWECPAVTGNLICPRFVPSMDYSPEGRPEAVEPPEFGFCANMRPADGRDGAVQRGEITAGTPLPVLSMSLPNTVRPKVRSKHLIGSIKWIKSVQRRGSIEGSFGTLKSRSGIGFTKGYVAVGGQVQHTILGTIALAVLNYQTTFAWIARGGCTQDPVFAPLPQMSGVKEVSAEEDREDRLLRLEAQKKVA